MRDNTTQKITPHLWFDGQAEEAANFYVSLFENSRILHVTHYGKEAAEVANRPEGAVMTVTFQLEGQMFIALNGGPEFPFTPAISLLVHCDTQEEVDRLWESLSAVPEAEQCGWLVDKYGLSWQIMPAALYDMMQDADPEKSTRVVEALLKMKKLDVAALQKAFDGE